MKLERAERLLKAGVGVCPNPLLGKGQEVIDVPRLLRNGCE